MFDYFLGREAPPPRPPVHGEQTQLRWRSRSQESAGTAGIAAEAWGRTSQADFQRNWLLLDTWDAGICLSQALLGIKAYSGHVQLNPEPNSLPILQISGFHLPGLSRPTLATHGNHTNPFLSLKGEDFGPGYAVFPSIFKIC